jgi:hypothetical protein
MVVYSWLAPGGGRLVRNGGSMVCCPGFLFDYFVCVKNEITLVFLYGG